MNHDFSLYKQNTISRRIKRRMHVHQIDEIDDYLRFLKRHEREMRILFKDLLIGVTSFFRDLEAFVALKGKILKKTVRQKGGGPRVPGLGGGLLHRRGGLFHRHPPA